MSRLIIKHIGDNRVFYCDILGHFHREDGPAIIYDDGRELWYYNGEYLKDVHSVDDLIIKKIIE